MKTEVEKTREVKRTPGVTAFWGMAIVPLLAAIATLLMGYSVWRQSTRQTTEVEQTTSPVVVLVLTPALRTKPPVIASPPVSSERAGTLPLISEGFPPNPEPLQSRWTPGLVCAYVKVSDSDREILLVVCPPSRWEQKAVSDSIPDSPEQHPRGSDAATAMWSARWKTLPSK